MSSDYKYDIQMRAEELAESRDLDFYSLPSEQQCAIYQEATNAWTDAVYARADMMRDAAKDGH